MVISCDRSLSQKLERTEARANAAFVESRARYMPDVFAQWFEIAGTYVLFDGPGSPLTQTFGLGVFDKITETELSSIERFFKERKSAVYHEVSPLADLSLMPLLNKRGYHPVELSNAMFIALDDQKYFSVKNPAITTRIIKAGEEKLWGQICADGWSTEGASLSNFILEFGTISAKSQGAFPFLATLSEDPIAAGMLFIFDNVALLGGASTVPKWRGLGAQSALLQARLHFAQKNGCSLAMMCAAPGSQSQRNAERNGFKVAYTRTKWQLEI